MSYASNASTGTVVAGGNGAGTLSNQLRSPFAVCFDSSSNSLLIANYYYHDIVRWVIGSSGWTLVVGSVGAAGYTALKLEYPTDVIFDSMGNIYVADMRNERVQFFRSGQPNGTTIAGITDTPGRTIDTLYYPYSMALDKDLNLYVADTYNHRVQKFDRY